MLIQRSKKSMLVLPLFVLAFSFVACSGGSGGDGDGPQVLPPVTVVKDRTPSFGFSQRYGPGLTPKVGITAYGTVVGVSRDNDGNMLYSKMGQVNEKGVLTWQGKVQYDFGNEPDVAVSANGTVVEVHRTDNWIFTNELWYHVGKVTGNSIAWGTSIKYDTGYTPRVTTDGTGLVLEVHRAGNGDDLYYKVGRVNADGNGIDWNDSVRYDSGAGPDVAMNSSRVAVAVHQANSGKLYYYVGRLDRYSQTLSWGAAVYYDDGANPSVDITDDGLVLEAHESSNRKLYYRVGMVSGNQIIWHGRAEFDSGRNVSVACDGSHAVEVHNSGPGQEYFSSSLLLNRKRWMQSLPLLWARPLWKTVLPGTQDSGAYMLSSDRVPVVCRDPKIDVPPEVAQPFAAAQSKTLVLQLAEGIRYLDIKPVLHNNEFYMYHDWIGSQPLSTELDHIAVFLANEGPELVILNIGAFCSFDDSVHARLVNLINSKIGPWLYKGSTEDLLARTMGELMVPNANVFLIYGDDYIVSHPTPGFLRSLPINGAVSNTPDLNVMWADQQKKLRTESTSSNLFMLNWTLNIRADHWPEDAIYVRLHDITKEANQSLGDFINETYNGTPNSNYQMNILSVDFFEQTKNVDYAVWLNSLH